MEETLDPDACAFELARDRVTKGGSVDSALDIVWARSPRDVAVHGEAIRQNLVALQMRRRSPQVKASNDKAKKKTMTKSNN